MGLCESPHCENTQGLREAITEEDDDDDVDETGIAGFPQALEIMENLENHQIKFHTWKNH